VAFVAREPDEPFELLEQLGRGGFACTYLARVVDSELRDEYQRDEVALKVPLGRREERVLRHEMELNAGLHMRLKSENLVRYLGFTVFRGRIVMVMEYVPEGSLRGHLGKIGHQRRLPPSEALGIAVGTLRGLALIHAEQVFHRDIKPENILLAQGVPKIADLGIARLLDSDALAVTQAGTLPYMSPEILSSEGASYTSDIWSVGVTLYEMVTGRLPFGDERTPIRGFVELICEAKPLPASEACPDVSPALSAVIARALRKERAARFATAEDMAQALEALGRVAQPTIDDELAAVRAAMDDPAQADVVEARLRRLAESHPREHGVYRLLGELLGRRQRHREAVEVLRRGAELAPAEGLLQWKLALALQSVGDRRAAETCLSRALELGLPDPLRSQAALLLRALGKSGH
jgi:serine/threonine protein kinase